jgi:hypothetical protein
MSATGLRMHEELKTIIGLFGYCTVDERVEKESADLNKTLLFTERSNTYAPPDSF